ncbi:MAG: PKD domain-containing protein, partial [Thermoplasmatota archaeon]
GLNAIPDVVNDGSWEMVAGGRNGKLTCFSGGLDAGNSPPTKPVINGPTNGIVGVTYEFSFVSTDPENEDIYYFVDWGDGSNTGWFGPFESGVPVTKSHSWLSTGNYYIKAKAKDEKGAESGWSNTYPFIVTENQPPNTPEISGPTSGKPGVELTYTVMTTDPNNDDVYYYIDWGDNSNTGWIGPNASGGTVTVKHTFTKKGTYTINYRAKDIYGLQSGWGTLKVTVPRTKVPLINRLLDRFPNLFPILRHLLGL